MPRVSNTTISNEFKIKIEKAFPTALSTLKSHAEIQDFYKNFLTEEEQTMMGKRLLIYVLIYKGFPAQRIKKVLGVSFEAIRHHETIYSKLDPITRNLIKHLSEKLF